MAIRFASSWRCSSHPRAVFVSFVTRFLLWVGHSVRKCSCRSTTRWREYSVLSFPRDLRRGGRVTTVNSFQWGELMATNQALAPSTAPNPSFNLMRVLSLPWLDRTIAAIACVPLVYLAYYRYEHWHHGFPLIAAALNTLIVVVTMIIRRPPKRVTPNPLYWLLAFVATYW